VQELDSSKRSYSEIIEGLLKYLPSVSSQDVLSDYCVGEILIEDVILKENYPKNFVSRFDGYLCKGIPPFKLVKEAKESLHLSWLKKCIQETSLIFP